MTRTLVVILGYLLLCGTVMAQTQATLPGKVEPQIDTCPHFPCVKVKMQYDGTDGKYPPKFTAFLPVPHRTADRAYWLSTAGAVLATVADIENSMYALKQPGVQEASPLYGSHPGRARYYAIAMPVTGFMAYMSWRWKREDDAVRAEGWGQHKWMHWHFPNDLMTAAHAAGVAITLSATGR